MHKINYDLKTVDSMKQQSNFESEEQAQTTLSEEDQQMTIEE